MNLKGLKMIKTLTAADPEIYFQVLVNDIFINTMVCYKEETTLFVDGDEEPFTVKEKPEEIIPTSSSWIQLTEYLTEATVLVCPIKFSSLSGFKNEGVLYYPHGSREPIEIKESLETIIEKLKGRNLL